MYAIVGFKKVNYTNKDKKQVNGVEFYLVNQEKLTGENCAGCDCMVLYLSSDRIGGTLEVGRKADLMFSVNRGQARIDGIIIH